MGFLSRVLTFKSEHLGSKNRTFPYELSVALLLDLLFNPNFSDLFTHLFSEVLSLTFLIGISQIFGENVGWILTHILIAVFAFRLGASLTFPNIHGVQLTIIFIFTFFSSLLVVETWILGIPPVVSLEMYWFFFPFLVMILTVNAVCWIALASNPEYWLAIADGSTLPSRIAGVFGFSVLAGGVVASIFNFGVVIEAIALFGLFYILISKTFSSWNLPKISPSLLPDVGDIIYRSNRTVVDSALGFAGAVIIFLGFILAGYFLL